MLRRPFVLANSFEDRYAVYILISICINQIKYSLLYILNLSSLGLNFDNKSTAIKMFIFEINVYPFRIELHPILFILPNIYRSAKCIIPQYNWIDTQYRKTELFILRHYFVDEYGRRFINL